MDDKDTVITVGVTRLDEYGNMWVTPQGGGKEIKIASRRKNLHPLFEQGKAVMLHWEVYKDNPYVADAKWVEGILPAPKPAYTPPPETPRVPAPQELGMWWKEMGCRIGDGSLERDFPRAGVKIKGHYYKKMSEVTGVRFD